MGDWDYTGVHGLNKYIWSRLKTDLGWSSTDYNGLIPIVTPQQQPEFNSLNKPYIVYSYTISGASPEWWMKREIAIYTIFSASTSEIRSAVNLIESSLGRYEESAKEVNRFIQDKHKFDSDGNLVNTIPGNGSTDNKKFDYKIITTTQAAGPEPSLSEGGRHDARVIVSMEYTHYNVDAGPEQSDSIRL